MTVLQIGNVKIPYEEIKSEKYKRISLRVTSEKVRLSAPKKASELEIRKFLDANRNWILDNWLKFQEKDMKRISRFYQSGVKVPLLGKDYEIIIVETNTKRLSANCNEEKRLIMVSLPKEVGVEERQEAIGDVLKELFKLKARRIFREKLDLWSQRMGVKYNQFRLKEQKTRWGSCSSLGNINLNWRAIMAPEPVVDYLIIHELAHLKHLNHSKAFWGFVAEFCQEYKKCRTWLRENERSLFL